MQNFEYLDVLETRIKTVDLISASSLRRSAVGLVDNTLSLVAADAACFRAGDAVVAACEDLAGAAGGLIPSTKQNTELSAKRQEALSILSKLRQECERCGPNETAKILRLV